MEQIDDLEIIKRAKNGDIAAFDELIKKYRNMIFYFTLKRVRIPEEAEDLVQEIFIEVFKSIKRFENRSGISAWLYGISKNLINNYFNRQFKKNQKCKSIEDLTFEIGRDDSGLEKIENNLILKSLKNSLSMLNDDLYDAINFVIFEGMSYDEAALALDVPVGTIKSRIFRARAELKEKMKDVL